MTEDVFGVPSGLSTRPANFQGEWIEKGRYRLPHPDDPTKRLDAERASNFAKTISNTFTLNMHNQRLIVKGMATHPSLVLDAVEQLSNGHTPWELNKELMRIATEAKNFAGSKESSSKGTFLHGLSVKWDAGVRPLLPEPWSRDLQAYQAMLTKMGIQCVPEYTEKTIYIRDMNICGTFDRLVRYMRYICPICGPDRWRVLDLKTGRDLQYGWAEIPIQLWCYASGDVMCDSQNFDGWSPMPDTCPHMGLVLHLPQGEARATLYEVDLATRIDVPHSARPADIAIAVQKWRATRKLAKPVARVCVSEEGEVMEVPLTWEERIDLATSSSELEDIRSEAGSAWHGGLTRRKNERLALLSS